MAMLNVLFFFLHNWGFPQKIIAYSISFFFPEATLLKKTVLSLSHMVNVTQAPVL